MSSVTVFAKLTRKFWSSSSKGLIDPSSSWVTNPMACAPDCWNASAKKTSIFAAYAGSVIQAVTRSPSAPAFAVTWSISACVGARPVSIVLTLVTYAGAENGSKGEVAPAGIPPSVAAGFDIDPLEDPAPEDAPPEDA